MKVKLLSGAKMPTRSHPGDAGLPEFYAKPIFAVLTPDYRPLRILKSGIATIVFWQDGTKTVVKRGSDEPESDYAAFTAALGIKIFGSNSALKRIVSRTETQEKKGRKDEVE